MSVIKNLLDENLRPFLLKQNIKNNEELHDTINEILSQDIDNVVVIMPQRNPCEFNGMVDHNAINLEADPVEAFLVCRDRSGKAKYQYITYYSNLSDMKKRETVKGIKKPVDCVICFDSGTRRIVQCKACIGTFCTRCIIRINKVTCCICGKNLY